MTKVEIKLHQIISGLAVSIITYHDQIYGMKEAVIEMMFAYGMNLQSP